VIIVLMLGIVAMEIWVDWQFGAAWGFISAFAGLALWLLIRPWKLALLSQESRRQVLISGTFTLISILVSAGLSYWKHWKI